MERIIGRPESRLHQRQLLAGTGTVTPLDENGAYAAYTAASVSTGLPLYQQTFDAILKQIGYQDWSSLELMIAELLVVLLIILLSALIREAVHVRRQKRVWAQLKEWADCLPFPFQALSEPEQLNALAPLRRLQGHPAYIVHALVSLRLHLEELGAASVMLATLDEIATQHQSKGRRTYALR